MFVLLFLNYSLESYCIRFSLFLTVTVNEIFKYDIVLESVADFKLDKFTFRVKGSQTAFSEFKSYSVLARISL